MFDAIIILQRNTALADAHHAGRMRVVQKNRARTRVGLDLTPKVSLGDVSPESAEETLDAVHDALSIFQHDVAVDACPETYGPECEGSDPQVDKVAACLLSKEAAGESIDARSALECAGVAVTADNLAKFAACVKAREDAFGHIPRGTLGVCAIAVRRGVTAAKAHTTVAWRGSLEKWSRQFEIFRDKWKTAAAGEVGVTASATGPSMATVTPWAEQYNNARAQFIAQGGHTTAPGINLPSSFPWGWLAVGVVIVVGAYVLNSLTGVIHAVKT